MRLALLLFGTSRNGRLTDLGRTRKLRPVGHKCCTRLWSSLFAVPLRTSTIRATP